jgi:CIC family chloride channel protein
VPIAAMLMVTEMTGGYHLLAAAALAVMLSYLTQVTLSARFKYKSLYEAQVAGRADSPAHQAEQLETTIQLLQTCRICAPPTCSHLNLQTLLASGIPIDLPDGKRLGLGVLKSKSPYVGQSVQKSFPVDGQEDLEVVAIFREGNTLLPHSGIILQANDRLLVLASQEAWSRLELHLSPPTL